MAGSVIKLMLIFSVTITNPAGNNCQILRLETQFPTVISLLENVTDTSATVSSILPHLEDLLKNQEDVQMQTSNNLTQIAATQTQTSNTLTQMAATQSEMAATQTQISNTLTQVLTQMAASQTQMANTFSQVVSLLQMQGQQVQNMTATMNTVVSVLKNQQETLENVSHSLLLVTDQQARQIELLQILPQSSDCSDVASQGNSLSGTYTISTYNEQFNVYCDMDTDFGGWTVFQKRYDNSTDFYRGWDDYERGFGSAYGQYWLGLSRIHQMTRSGIWTLRIDMEAFDGDTAYAEYESFNVGDAASNYTLSIGSYSGTAGNSLSLHNNMQFSTYDRDNDAWSGSGNCAQVFQGAWWYKACHHSNLNGLYLGPSGNSYTGMWWYHWKRYNSLKRSEMKMRRVQ